jgi:hypothetical protein
MHEILHVIGLCPDSLSHLDLIDLFINQYVEIINLLINCKSYVVSSIIKNR